MSCLFVEASITTPSIVFIPYQQNKKKIRQQDQELSIMRCNMNYLKQQDSKKSL